MSFNFFFFLSFFFFFFWQAFIFCKVICLKWKHLKGKRVICLFIYSYFSVSIVEALAWLEFILIFWLVEDEGCEVPFLLLDTRSVRSRIVVSETARMSLISPITKGKTTESWDIHAVTTNPKAKITTQIQITTEERMNLVSWFLTFLIIFFFVYNISFSFSFSLFIYRFLYSAFASKMSTWFVKVF